MVNNEKNCYDPGAFLRSLLYEKLLHFFMHYN